MTACAKIAQVTVIKESLSGDSSCPENVDNVQIFLFPGCSVCLFHQSVPCVYSINQFHLSVPSVCFTSLFRLSVPHVYVCFINLFHTSVPSVCSIRLFHQSVPLVCSIRLFHQSISVYCFACSLSLQGAATLVRCLLMTSHTPNTRHKMEAPTAVVSRLSNIFIVLFFIAASLSSSSSTSSSFFSSFFSSFSFFNFSFF